MYAVIVSGGKQYKVAEGDVIEVEKLALEIGAKVELPVLLTVDGDKVVAGGDVKVKATAEVLAQGKDKKIVVFKYKAKKNVRKKLGHRQPFTISVAEKAKTGCGTIAVTPWQFIGGGMILLLAAGVLLLGKRKAIA